jgi:hypothetical protein
MLWLAATDVVPDTAQVRSWWNLKESDALDAVLQLAPKSVVGPLFWDPNDLQGSGPARRVFDLLWLRGTTPDYVLPILDAVDWTVSIVSTINRTHQHATTLPRDTGGVVESQESGRRAS